MQPQFKIPDTKEAFEKQANEMTLDGAKSVLRARKSQRDQAIKPFDDEIEFLEKVIAFKSKNL